MVFMESLKKLPHRFYYQAISFVLAFITLFYIANVGQPMSKVPEEYTPALITLIIGLVIQIAGLILTYRKMKYSEYLNLAAVVLFSLALAFFMAGSTLSLIDKIYNIVMWGDATQTPAIIAFGSLLTIGTILDIVACWKK